MTDQDQIRLGTTLWAIADELRGAMNADDFRDYMLSFLFLRYLSDNYERAARFELGEEWPQPAADDRRSPLAVWYEQNPADTEVFEEMMRRKVYYVIKAEFLWGSIAELARTQATGLLDTLQKGFRFIEQESFSHRFQGLFSEINLDSEKLGKTHAERNIRLYTIIRNIAEGLAEFPTDSDVLGDAYEYLIGQFAAGSGKKAGEFYTPQRISGILSGIVALDSQNPASGQRDRLNRVLDFACGSGSLLLNVRRRAGRDSVGKLYGQEKNITTSNLARMNMLLHNVHPNAFEIHHGDSLANDWDMLREANPARKIEFDAVIANPPFSYRWTPSGEMAQDFRFRDYGLAPKSAADFAFLLHGLHFLSAQGTMAIILPHGVLFRGGAEGRIRMKLLKDGNIDAVIGLPSKLFYSTGIPVCILVLKKCKQTDDVLFINAAGSYQKGKRQNVLLQDHIDDIIDTYRYRKEKARYSRCASLEEIAGNDFNLNIPRYVDTSVPEEEINVAAVQKDVVQIGAEMAGVRQRMVRHLEQLDIETGGDR